LREQEDFNKTKLFLSQVKSRSLQLSLLKLESKNWQDGKKKRTRLLLLTSYDWQKHEKEEKRVSLIFIITKKSFTYIFLRLFFFFSIFVANFQTN